MRWPNRDLHNRVYAHISRLSPAWILFTLLLLLRHILCKAGPQRPIPMLHIINEALAQRLDPEPNP